MANRIKKGDQVVVIAGKDKGKKGDVVRVEGDRVVVSNVNIIKRLSNIALFNPASGKGERIGFKVLEDGRKLRVFRSSGEALDA